VSIINNASDASLLAPALLVVAVACHSPTKPQLPTDAVRLVGTVHYSTLEGGFWAVRGDEGVTYDPLGRLPQTFQREKLRVSMVVRIRREMASIHMVGPIIEILQIQAL